MSDFPPSILWFRRDLRLRDNDALAAASSGGRAVIPVFINDDSVARLGAAPKWRLGLSLESLDTGLRARGSRLILRRGEALEVLQKLVRETGARSVHWSRLYDPESIRRDSAVKAGLKLDGIETQSHNGHLLFEPWTVSTQSGGFYKVFTPMWRAVKDRDVPAPRAAAGVIPGPAAWPESDDLKSWSMGAQMGRGAAICLAHQRVGERAAQDRLAGFMSHAVAGYGTDRNLPAKKATSGLSENLAYGEISPRRCWHAGRQALLAGAEGADQWLRELVWREFAYHLLYHTPEILSRSWRADWQGFPWRTDADSPQLRAWKQGRTGIAFVDAAMREMYVTGKMHNRARMVVASFLTKHLLIHWRIGMRWFANCLTDWDPASNAMGWQWVAGSGPDAAPFFRIFNPATQAEKFDPDGAYRRRWLAEGRADPTPESLSFFDAIPRSWGLGAADAYPAPVVDLKEGRDRALAVYAAR